MRWCLSSCIFDDKMRHLKDFIAYSDSVVNNIASHSVTRLVNNNVMWNRIGNDQTRGAMSQRANSNQWECSVPFLSRARLRHASIIFFQVVLFFFLSFLLFLSSCLLRSRYATQHLEIPTHQWGHNQHSTQRIAQSAYWSNSFYRLRSSQFQSFWRCLCHCLDDLPFLAKRRS